MEKLEAKGARKHIPVILGGIVPKDDIELLKKEGISAVFTPSDYEITDLLKRCIELVEQKE